MVSVTLAIIQSGRMCEGNEFLMQSHLICTLEAVALRRLLFYAFLLSVSLEMIHL